MRRQPRGIELKPKPEALCSLGEQVTGGPCLTIAPAPGLIEPVEDWLMWPHSGWRSTSFHRCRNKKAGPRHCHRPVVADNRSGAGQSELFSGLLKISSSMAAASRFGDLCLFRFACLINLVAFFEDCFKTNKQDERMFVVFEHGNGRIFAQRKCAQNLSHLSNGGLTLACWAPIAWSGRRRLHGASLHRKPICTARR